MMDTLVPEKSGKAIPPAPAYGNIANQYQSALKVVDDVILKNYITELSDLEVVPLSDKDIQFNLRDQVRFFKINKMVYEKEENAAQKLASVFNSLPICNSTLFLIIHSNGSNTEFYMGVRSNNRNSDPIPLIDAVENALNGHFPGSNTDSTSYTDLTDRERVLRKITADNICAVSCVANDKAHDGSTNQNFIQGLEKLILSMQVKPNQYSKPKPYTCVVIANSTPQSQLRELRRSYEAIYTQLSAFAETQVNYASNHAFNYSLAETHGNSTAQSKTSTWSDSQNRSEQHGTSQQHGTTKENTASKVLKGVAAASSIVGTALAPFTGGVSLIAGGVVSGGIGLLASAVSSSVSDSTSTSESVTTGFTTTRGGSEGTTETVNYGISETEGYTKGITEGMTLTLHDKSIENMLERIDKQLKRIDEFESLGMYECAAYFMSKDRSTAEIAAATYKALMRGENSGVEIAAINTWDGRNQKERTAMVAQYVKNFMHPVFRYNTNYQDTLNQIEVTPCSLVSGNELSIHMGLPRKSVCGLPVIEHADFAKEIVRYDENRPTSSIKLGNVFNMGVATDSRVDLSVESLSMHTFITGSTGSGKSNTIYELLRKLDDRNINYLVIEPAKGEYKHVFGNLPGVRVYGTNPMLTDLLRIDPFKFPNGIHVLEHIDRLIEIFNVCWPMYAAMPAVLKNAVEKAYIDCGWDMVRSINRLNYDLYPSFTDVARNIREIIDSSDYDNDNKGAYKGSLLTRLQSLTNGIYGMIFNSDELDNAQLFDRKVIVDLSRVGSMETKSLIMGMLVLKLQEYRMSTATGMNRDLQHVTVLEEAHNLLKRTSAEQSSESGNLQGKSVEMLTNAIAEMRTYGEGFVIADQSPGLLDLAVIRNTNTKIIMRMPDHADRELVGRAANLNDDQILEIAKLPCGVAAIYQNDWVQPVLCKIPKYDKETTPYQHNAPDAHDLDDTAAMASRSLLECIMNTELSPQAGGREIQELRERIIRSKLDTTVKKDYLEYLAADGSDAIVSLRKLVFHFLSAEKAIKASTHCTQIHSWVHNVVDNLSPSIKEFSAKQIDLVLALILYEQSLRDPEYNNLFCRFTEVFQVEGGVFR